MSGELTSRRLGSSFNSVSVRLLHSYHIDAMLTLLEELLPTEASEILSAELDSVQEALNGQLSTTNLPQTLGELVNLFVEESLKSGSVGFLLKAEQPHFVYTGTGQLSYSWDYTRSRWFYGQTYQEALFRVYRWASRNKEVARTRSGSQGALS